MLSSFLSSVMTTLLTMTTDTDLFKPEWTEGNLLQIDGVVNVLTSVSCTLISVIGFGIVIFSILKNALSGLYVVAPNIFDKVDAIKRKDTFKKASLLHLGNSMSTFGEIAQEEDIGLGAIGVAVLKLIPNVKVLTDFEDGSKDIDKKQYFIHAIPVLVAQIFVGMMIFFGYPAKIANWIGGAGTYALSAVINNVDPVQFISGISDSLISYTLQTDTDGTTYGKNVNKVTKSLLTTVKTTYGDISSQNFQDVAFDTESVIQRLVSEAVILNGDSNNSLMWSDIFSAKEGWDITYSVNTIPSTTTPRDGAIYLDMGTSKPNTVCYLQQQLGVDKPEEVKSVSTQFIVNTSTLVRAGSQVTARYNDNLDFVVRINAKRVAIQENVNTATGKYYQIKDGTKISGITGTNGAYEKSFTIELPYDVNGKTKNSYTNINKDNSGQVYLVIDGQPTILNATAKTDVLASTGIKFAITVDDDLVNNLNGYQKDDKGNQIEFEYKEAYIEIVLNDKSTFGQASYIVDDIRTIPISSIKYMLKGNYDTTKVAYINTAWKDSDKLYKGYSGTEVLEKTSDDWNADYKDLNGLEDN